MKELYNYGENLHVPVTEYLNFNPENGLPTSGTPQNQI